MDQDSKNPVNEYRDKRAKAMNDTLADMGFGGNGDKKTNRAQADKSNAALDDFEDKYGIGKAAKGPSTASRIGKAFRNFGSRVQGFFSSKPAAQATPQAIPPAPAVERTEANKAEVKETIGSPSPEMGFSRADARAKAAAMSTRAETLAVAKAVTEQQQGAKTVEHGLER